MGLDKIPDLATLKRAVIEFVGKFKKKPENYNAMITNLKHPTELRLFFNEFVNTLIMADIYLNCNVIEMINTFLKNLIDEENDYWGLGRLFSEVGK